MPALDLNALATQAADIYKANQPAIQQAAQAAGVTLPNGASAPAAPSKMPMILGVAAAAGAVWYFFLRKGRSNPPCNAHCRRRKARR